LIEILKERNDISYEASDALKKIGYCAISALIEAFKYGDNSVRLHIAQVLGRIGPDAKDAVSVLIETLADKNETIHSSVTKALIKIGSSDIPAVIEALNNKDEFVRNSAATILTKIALNTEAIQILINELRNRDNFIKITVINKLGMSDLKAIDAIPSLIEELKNEDEVVRKTAEKAIIQISSKTSMTIPFLVSALKDDNELVKNAAKDILLGIKPSANNIPPAIVEALIRYG